MRKQDVLALFDYNYWANWKILAAVREIPQEQFIAPTSVTWRNVRGTLVHTLDVEQSWRRRIRGEDKAIWDAELPAEQFRHHRRVRGLLASGCPRDARLAPRVGR